MKQEERAEQIALFHWAAWQVCNMPELVLLFAIPNGGSRDIREAMNLKASGVKRGVPDVCLPVARQGYNCLWIEMKSRQGKQTEDQRQFMYKLIENGGDYHLCRSFEEARDAILEYLGFPAQCRPKPASLCTRSWQGREVGFTIANHKQKVKV